MTKMNMSATVGHGGATTRLDLTGIMPGYLKWLRSLAADNPERIDWINRHGPLEDQEWVPASELNQGEDQCS